MPQCCAGVVLWCRCSAVVQVCCGAALLHGVVLRCCIAVVLVCGAAVLGAPGSTSVDKCSTIATTIIA